VKKTETKEIIALIVKFYPNHFKDITKELVEVWHSALSDVEFSSAQNALLKHVKTSEYAPTVSQLRKSHDLANAYSGYKRLEDMA